MLTETSLDIKKVFTSGLEVLQKRVQNRFYTTTMAFVQDLGNIFHTGIVTQPAPDPEEPIAAELKRPVVLDIKERRRLAKRIIRAVQPQLHLAANAEADICAKPSESLISELDQLLEACVQFTGDTARSIGDTASQADVDVHMSNGLELTNGDTTHEEGKLAESARTVDVEMQDVELAGEEEGNPSLTNGTTETGVTDTILAEVDPNVSQASSDLLHGTKSNKPSDRNGNTSISETANPPTPPLSNGDAGTDRNDVLTQGGVPWYLKEFNPEGTSISQEKWNGRDAVARLSEDLSDMDDEALNGLGADVAGAHRHAIVAAPVVKAKKARPKRNRRR